MSSAPELTLKAFNPADRIHPVKGGTVGSALPAPPVSFQLSQGETRISTPFPPPAKKSMEERLFEALVAAKVRTSLVAMHLHGGVRDKIFAQLNRLHDADEWPEGDEPLKLESFKTFLRFLLLFEPELRPSLGLSPDGNLLAAWVKEENRLMLEFCELNRVSWLVVREDANTFPERGSGVSTVDRLPEVLAPYRPEDWISRG